MTSNEPPPPTQPAYQKTLSADVAKKETRKMMARKNEGRSMWFGLGMMGLVGWSVALPTILGIAVGVWMDNRWDRPISSTLTCMFLGLVAGCAIAAYWIKREFVAASNGYDSSNTTNEDERGES